MASAVTLTHHDPVTVDLGLDLDEMTRLAGVRVGGAEAVQGSLALVWGKTYQVELSTFTATGGRGFEQVYKTVTNRGYQLIVDVPAFLAFMRAHPGIAVRRHLVMGLPSGLEPGMLDDNALRAYGPLPEYVGLHRAHLGRGLVGPCTYVVQRAPTS
jgi:hypothetical protein